MSNEFFEIRKTFVDSPSNCANTNWETFFAAKDPGNIWSHNQAPDAHVKWFLEHYNLPKNITVLDSGCGEGKNLRLLEQFDDVYGVDISQTAVDNARTEFPLVNYSAQDAADLDFTNEMFDVIIDAGCLHCNHPMQHQKIINQYHRILKPNGKLFFRLFHTDNDDNTSPIFYFDLGDDQFMSGTIGKIPVYGFNHKLIKKLIDGLFNPDEVLWDTAYDENGVHYIYFSKINI
tara:strand:+ start:343 stop:1038 length:696 start_codon:yes stop_codon:yes gene_type:complete